MRYEEKYQNKKFQNVIYVTYIQQCFKGFINWSNIVDGYSSYTVITVFLNSDYSIAVYVKKLEICL